MPRFQTSICPKRSNIHGEQSILQYYSLHAFLSGPGGSATPSASPATIHEQHISRHHKIQPPKEKEHLGESPTLIAFPAKLGMKPSLIPMEVIEEGDSVLEQDMPGVEFEVEDITIEMPGIEQTVTIEDQLMTDSTSPINKSVDVLALALKSPTDSDMADADITSRQKSPRWELRSSRHDQDSDDDDGSLVENSDDDILSHNDDDRSDHNDIFYKEDSDDDNIILISSYATTKPIETSEKSAVQPIRTSNDDRHSSVTETTTFEVTFPEISVTEPQSGISYSTTSMSGLLEDIATIDEDIPGPTKTYPRSTRSISLPKSALQAKRETLNKLLDDKGCPPVLPPTNEPVQHQVVRLQNQKYSLEKELQAALNEYEKLEGAWQKAVKQNQDLTETMEAQENMSKDTDEMLEMLEEAASEWKGKTEDLEEERNAIVEEAAELRTLLGLADDNIRRMTRKAAQEISRLRSEIDSMDSSGKDRSDQIARLQAEKKAIEGHLSAQTIVNRDSGELSNVPFVARSAVSEAPRTEDDLFRAIVVDPRSLEDKARKIQESLRAQSRGFVSEEKEANLWKQAITQAAEEMENSFLDKLRKFSFYKKHGNTRVQSARILQSIGHRNAQIKIILNEKYRLLDKEMVMQHKRNLDFADDRTAYLRKKYGIRPLKLDDKIRLDNLWAHVPMSHGGRD